MFTEHCVCVRVCVCVHVRVCVCVAVFVNEYEGTPKRYGLEMKINQRMLHPLSTSGCFCPSACVNNRTHTHARAHTNARTRTYPIKTLQPHSALGAADGD